MPCRDTVHCGTHLHNLFSKINFRPRSLKCSRSLRLPNQNSVRISSFPMRSKCPPNFILSDKIALVKLNEELGKRNYVGNAEYQPRNLWFIQFIRSEKSLHWDGFVARMWQTSNECWIILWECCEMQPIRRQRCGWEDNIKTDIAQWQILLLELLGTETQNTRLLPVPPTLL